MLPAGIKVRFQAQLDNTHLGHVWEVTTKVNSTDLYLENSYIKDSIHVSHHASGRWHYALPVKPKEYLSISNDRTEVAPGWTHASRIVVTKQDAVLNNFDQRAIQVPFQHSHPAIAIDIFLSEIGAVPVKIENAYLIEELALGATHQACLVARPYLTEETPQEAFKYELLEIKESLLKSGWNGELTSVIIILDTESNFGYLQQVEVSVSSGD